ncbi:MAG: CHASE2 domain-containing protein [bacterium]
MVSKRRKKTGQWGCVCALLISLSIIMLYCMHPRFIEVIELKFFDLRFRLRKKKPLENNIIIAAIDQKSIDELGRWPWPRSKIKSLIERLSDAGAQVIAFDIVFQAPEKNILAEFIKEYSYIFTDRAEKQRLMKMLDQINPDRDLSQAIEKAGNVILGMFFFLSPEEARRRGKEKVNQESRVLFSQRFPIIQQVSLTHSKDRVARGYGFEMSMEMLAQSAVSNGFINIYPDFDGIIRWAPLIIEHKGNFYPSLSMQIVKQYWNLQDDSILIKLGECGVEGLYIKEIPIPVDTRGNVLINYQGPEATFPHYSISDILDHRLPLKDLQGKIVLIGATATSIYDMRYTPYKIMSGVEIQASILNNLLNQTYLSIPSHYFLIEIVILLGIGLVLGIFLSFTPLIIGSVVTAALLIGYIYLNCYLLFSQGIWISLVYPLIEIFAIFTIINLYRYSTEEKERKKIKKSFEHYLAPALVQELINDPEKLQLGGEKQVLTVLFSDIRNFTTISEGLKPETLIYFLNEYMTAMSTIILDHFGFLDKFIGDAIMAVYCTPIKREDHAVLSCQTALKMQNELTVINEKYRPQKLSEIKIGIGINSGEMVIGNFGSKQRFDYTVLGDNVNLASRLEGITKVFGVKIIISEYTQQLIHNRWPVRELDIVRVKGKIKPVKIFELISLDDDIHLFEALCARYYEGLEAFRNRKWEDGLKKFQEALLLNPDDGPSKYYLERCLHYQKHPPPSDWDGISTITS